MDPQDTQHGLLHRTRSGDNRAWQRLSDLYRPLISGWAKRHAPDAHDAEDLTQGILLQVVRHLPGFQHNGRPGAFRTWLRTLAVHCTHDFWSARQGEPRGAGAADVHERLQQFQDPTSELTRAWDV